MGGWEGGRDRPHRNPPYKSFSFLQFIHAIFLYSLPKCSGKQSHKAAHVSAPTFVTTTLTPTPADTPPMAELYSHPVSKENLKCFRNYLQVCQAGCCSTQQLDCPSSKLNVFSAHDCALTSLVPADDGVPVSSLFAQRPTFYESALDQLCNRQVLKMNSSS